jgi:DNA-binding LacI/PurR family transcriptional regulator
MGRSNPEETARRRESLATIKDVAKKAGVTIGTVSRVLNNKKWVSDDCKKRVLQAIKDLHYKPQAHARRLRQKHSFVWGVIAPHHNGIFKSPFFSDILAGMEEVAAENRYRLLIHPLTEAARAQVSYRALLGDGSVDGMFVLNAWSTDVSVRELSESNVPFVLVNGRITAQEDFPYVGVDNRGGVIMAMEHLVGLGHERIGMINGRMTTTNGMERFQAYQDFLASRKMEFQPEWVGDGDFEEAGGYQACRKIFSGARLPSALLCACDLMAIGATRALKEMGLGVPANVSVMGFDNMEEARYHEPSLTTVAFSAQRMGRMAAEKMVSLVAEAKLVENASALSGELISRDSVRKV